jgi:predicted choloylglycine hydrolase
MKKRYKALLIIAGLFIVLTAYFRIRVSIDAPVINEKARFNDGDRIKAGNDFYLPGDSWLKKNEYGLWELYVTGDAFELGVKNGILTKELAQYQEEAFVESLRELIPSDFYLRFLKYFVAWFDRDIDKYIPEEYLKEIYGISLSASTEYSFIAPEYQRILNYHAAHDIGHTVNNLGIVACTAFGVKNDRSADSLLLIGRNMDFFISDKFAENKIIAFYKPDSGYKFTFITWGGLIGVITGMNDQGLTVTLNAARSEIPTSAKTPVSIIARKILQYASTIEEAEEIASGFDSFVAESFLISSARENDFAIIEKSIDTTVLYHPGGNELILTNHFQSNAFKNRKLTIENKKETATLYRWKRTKQLLDRKKVHDVNSFVNILRDRRGLDDENIGNGNELAINQLIAHHSVVFKPEKLQMWVSVGPYQLGEYIVYDLNKVFSASPDTAGIIYDSDLTVPADTFLYSQEYKDFKEYKQMTARIKKALKDDNDNFINEKLIEKYGKLNPDYFYSSYIIGECYKKLGNKSLAEEYYKKALAMEIPNEPERNMIREKLIELSK